MIAPITSPFEPSKRQQQITIAIAWCLAWGDQQEPKFDLSVLKTMRQAMLEGKTVPEEVRSLVQQATNLQGIDTDYFPETLAQLKTDHSDLWNQEMPIGLVYGGATKIKQYVFEAAKLSDIRGASALLDRINLIDLPAFFHGEESERFKECQNAREYCQNKVRKEWLDVEGNFPSLSKALIPELIIYSTGGSILAFCPAAYVDQLSNAIEKRYTHETLIANSCVVGDTFRLLEIRFGLLNGSIEKTVWLDTLNSSWKTSPILRAYFGLTEPKDKEGQPTNPNLGNALKNRKNFNELVGKLANQFNQRRSGFDVEGDRSTRRYPPMFETHPYLIRDDSDRRSAVVKVSADQIPGEPTFSEPLARKHWVGQLTKREDAEQRKWFERARFIWEASEFDSWVSKFESFLRENQRVNQYDPEQRIFDSNQNIKNIREREARSLREIGDASGGLLPTSMRMVTIWVNISATKLKPQTIINSSAKISFKPQPRQPIKPWVSI